MTIDGGKPKIAVPQGSWRLVSYTMDQFALTRPGPGPKAFKGKRGAKPDQRSAAAPAAPVVVGTSGRSVILAAAATSESPAIRVGKDEVVPLPFGPPYKATISTSGRARAAPCGSRCC